MGTQDDFAFAQEFISIPGLSESEITFLWEPGFSTWAAFDVRVNSSMVLIAPDLSTATESFFGFDDETQQAVLGALTEFDTPT